MEPQTVELGEKTLYALAAIANPGMMPGDWIALGVGLSQCALIAWGIHRMSMGNEAREAQTELLREQTRALREQSNVLAGVGEGIREQSKMLAGVGEGIREQSKMLAGVGEGIREQSKMLAGVGEGIQVLLADRKN